MTREDLKEDIISKLILHKEKEGKKIEIELKIDEYQKRLDYAGTVYEDNEKDIIENMQIAGQAYDSMHSNTNKISDKVSSTAFNYKKELNHINKEDREFLENEIRRLTLEKDKVDKEIARVKNWLNKITEEQNTVIYLFYIENKGKKWNKVVEEYKTEYNKDITDRGLRKIRDKAIESITNMVEI